MSARAETDRLFFQRTGLDESRVEQLVGDALAGADDGELFLEYRQSEALGFDDGRLKTASFDTSQGFGLRAICGERAGYAQASELGEAALGRAAEAVKAVTRGYGGKLDAGPAGTNRHLYADDNPLEQMAFPDKVALLEEI
ncbi:MAG: DNA gyrase modulator, partial [Dongiaceae bacterium]